MWGGGSGIEEPAAGANTLGLAARPLMAAEEVEDEAKFTAGALTTEPEVLTDALSVGAEAGTQLG